MKVLSFIVLALLVVILAVWGGGLMPQAVCIAAIVSCATAAVTALSASPPLQPARFPWLAALSLAALTVLILTALPWPPAAERLAGMERRAQNDTVRQALADCAAVGIPVDPAPWFSLSRNRTGTLRAILLLAAVIGTGSLAASLARKGRLAWLAILVTLGTAMAVAGNLGQWWIPQGDTLWWIFPVPHVLPGPVGCFINRNHFGGFLAMLVPMALGLAGWAAWERRWFASLSVLAAALVMTLALVMSLSRGAWLALAAGLSLTVLARLWRRRARDGWILLAGGLLLAGIVLAVPHPAVRTRLQSLRHPLEDSSAQSRLAEWRETLRVWPHYPLLGAGANALRMVYPQVRQTTSGRWLVHAENMPLEVLAEGGLIGVALVAGVAWLVIRRARQGATLLPDACRLGIGGALCVAGVHALWDFGLLVPVYTVTVASLIGVLLPPPAPATGVGRAVRLAPPLLGLLAAVALVPVLPDLRRLDSHESLQSASLRELQRALVQAPTSWHAWYYLGVAVAEDGVENNNLRRCRLGERLASQAARCDPKNYRVWYKVGEMRLALKDYDGAEAAFGQAKALRPWLVPPPIDRPKGLP